METVTSTTTSSSRWPTNQEILFAEGNHKRLLQEYKNCCAIVSFRFTADSILVYKEIPMYNLIELISSMGGIVSLWIGFTFIGIFDYLHHSLRLLYHIFVGDDATTAATPATKAATLKDEKKDSWVPTKRRTYAERMRDRGYLAVNYPQVGSDMLYDWQPKRGKWKPEQRTKRRIVDTSAPFPVYIHDAYSYRRRH